MGGGVFISDGGTFTMQDNAKISSNNAVTRGGGVCVGSGIFTMNGGTISDNTTVAKYYHYYYGGGGVYVSGTFSMLNGKISDNTSDYEGGGVKVGGGKFTLSGGEISGNTAERGGGGMYIGSNTCTISGGTISGNIANNGGGIYSSNTFNMRGNAIVANNTAKSHGGGIYSHGNFTIQDNATVTGNTADWGGGVFLSNYGGGDYTFTMQGNTTVSNNIARTRGGGIHSEAKTFNMKDGMISGNIAYQYGGGVCVAKGTFTMNGGTISGNTAQYGGGVYDNGFFKKNGGTLSGIDAEESFKNIAVINGYAIYNIGNNSWRNVSAGPIMNTETYGFWLNDALPTITFPSDFQGTWKRTNFNNRLTFTEDTIKSSNSRNLWILKSISGNAYTFKHSGAADTMELNITLNGDLIISGGSGSGENNWNGTWRKQQILNADLVIWSFSDELGEIVENYYRAAHPGVEVDYSLTPTEQFPNKLDPVLISGEGVPDIFALEAAFVRKYVESGLLLDLTDIYEANKAKLLKYPVEIGTFKGKVYAMSWQACPGAMFYRRSLAKKYLGTDDPKDVHAYFSNIREPLKTQETIA